MIVLLGTPSPKTGWWGVYPQLLDDVRSAAWYMEGGPWPSWDWRRSKRARKEVAKLIGAKEVVLAGVRCDTRALVRWDDGTVTPLPDELEARFVLSAAVETLHARAHQAWIWHGAGSRSGPHDAPLLVALARQIEAKGLRVIVQSYSPEILDEITSDDKVMWVEGTKVRTAGAHPALAAAIKRDELLGEWLRENPLPPISEVEP